MVGLKIRRSAGIEQNVSIKVHLVQQLYFAVVNREWLVRAVYHY